MAAYIGLDEYFPHELEDILLDETLESNDDEFLGSDVKSESEDNEGTFSSSLF